MFFDNYKLLCEKKGISISAAAIKCGANKSGVSYWKDGNNPSTAVLIKMSEFFGVSIDFLLNGDAGIVTTEDYTTFNVIGEVAAHYDAIANEELTGDTVDIPNSYLRGRDRSEFFVLRINGDSMFPTYQNGDKVLVLKQSTLNHSGQVGVIICGDEGTLKKVEYATGENWMRLVPINPAYPPKKICDEELEHCKVIGIPKLLIREIEE